MRDRKDTLKDARVVAFATHGLVSGQFDIAEPALVLAPPRANVSTEATDDGVLTASEVAQLRLSADWVLLSACNTASPDVTGAQGLSGLSRAFFYAGGKSLLVSHWRVDDEATKALVKTIFTLRSNQPGLSKAEALQQASLAVMNGNDLKSGKSNDDLEVKKDNRAHPVAWAACTLIGGVN